jgi:hypothetical protein
MRIPACVSADKYNAALAKLSRMTHLLPDK